MQTRVERLTCKRTSCSAGDAIYGTLFKYSQRFRASLTKQGHKVLRREDDSFVPRDKELSAIRAQRGN